MSYDRGNRRSESNKRRRRTMASNHVALKHALADGLFLTGGSRKSSPAPRSIAVHKQIMADLHGRDARDRPSFAISRRRFDLRGKRM